MNTFNLSREFFKWCFENSRKITPSHIAIYFFIIDLNNRLGWKKEIGLPSEHCMETLGIKKHQTFLKYLNELAEFGFIEIVQKSKNQYTSNIISIKSAMPKNGKALDKALGIAEVRHEVNQGLGKDNIDKQENLQTSKQVNIQTSNEYDFDLFWELYDKKVGDKNKIASKYNKLSTEDKQAIFLHVPKYIQSQPDKKYRKNPETYLNNKSWLDEIILPNSKPTKNTKGTINDNYF